MLSSSTGAADPEAASRIRATIAMRFMRNTSGAGRGSESSGKLHNRRILGAVRLRNKQRLCNESNTAISADSDDQGKRKKERGKRKSVVFPFSFSFFLDQVDPFSMPKPELPRIAVLGAGPIGIEAALY